MAYVDVAIIGSGFSGLGMAIRLRQEAMDDFVVWTDDLFGDLQGSSIPSVPVSRIPDARSADLIRAAVQASDTPRPGIARQGVRNTKRPFADAVYADIDARGRMLTSIPEQFDTLPPLRLASDWVYLMLHGDFDDSARFWGEDNDGGYPVAVATSSVCPACGLDCEVPGRLDSHLFNVHPDLWEARCAA